MSPGQPKFKKIIHQNTHIIITYLSFVFLIRFGYPTLFRHRKLRSVNGLDLKWIRPEFYYPDQTIYPSDLHMFDQFLDLLGAGYSNLIIGIKQQLKCLYIVVLVQKYNFYFYFLIQIKN